MGLPIVVSFDDSIIRLVGLTTQFKVQTMIDFCFHIHDNDGTLRIERMQDHISCPFGINELSF